MMIAAMIRALAIALCLLHLVPGAARAETWGEWAARARDQHPLAGAFYAPRQAPMPGLDAAIHDGKVRSEDDAEGRLYRFASADARGVVLPPLATIFLLGEVHDNPMHHRIRAWLVESRPVPGSLGAVVFEQIRVDQQSALERLQRDAGTAGDAADELFRLLEWEKTGWPPAAIYRPLLQAVLAARLPIYPGDPARGSVRAVARGGAAALGAEERARLRLDTALPEPLGEALEKELAGSHCGALPPAAIPGMAAAQRYRDASLADAVLAAEQRHGAAILIAGNGHIRADRGVPWHIRQRRPDARIMSILLAEVEAGSTDPAAYLPRDPQGKPAVDLVIFTPRAERGDPCEALKKSSAPSPARP